VRFIIILRRLDLGRVINPDSAGKERSRLSRFVVLCIRELAKQTEVNAEARDQAAFIALALQGISSGIEASVAAWEKRDYWVKADKFRMEWSWAGSTAQKMRQAVLGEDWAAVAGLSAQIGERFKKIALPEKNRLGKPWVGAYQELIRQGDSSGM
jgi:hypothetical protein